MSNKSLLVELFVEELPPKALKKLGEAFAAVLVKSLQDQGLCAADAAVTPFATPRRLAVHVTGVAARAADRAVEQKLVPVKVGLDAGGKATPVLLKKLAAIGADESAVAGCAAPRTARTRRFPRAPSSPAPASRPACRRRSTRRSPSCRSPR